MPVSALDPSPVASEAYGLFDASGLKQARLTLADGLQRFAGQLGELLNQLVDQVANVEVRTYVSENLADVKLVDGELAGPVKLRAFSRIAIHGNALVCVPEKEGELDQAIWAIHTETVQRAQAARLELIKTVASAATELLAGLQRVQ